MTASVDHIQVFFGDRKNGWAAAEYDAEGNQIEEARYSFHKADAVREARAMSGGIYPIQVYTQAGALQRTLYAPSA